jgi:hypothetical protein
LLVRSYRGPRRRRIWSARLGSSRTAWSRHKDVSLKFAGVAGGAPRAAPAAALSLDPGAVDVFAVVVWATATPPPMAFSRPALRSKPVDLEYVPTARAGHEHSAQIICCVSGSRLRAPKATTQAQALKLSAQGPWQSLMFLLLQRCSACCVGPLLDNDRCRLCFALMPANKEGPVAIP